MRSHIGTAFVTVVVAVLLSAGISAPAQAATGPAGDAFTLVNQQRAANGLGPLLTDPTLDYAAQAWAQYLADAGLFQHSSADWRSSIISGAGWTFSGENIAAGHTSASQVMNAWMNSDGHRANILNSSYVGVGIGYVKGGPYGHYWVQIFAGSQPRVIPGNAPVISGSATAGGTLNATLSGWASDVGIAWRWESNGGAIPGATSSSYKPSLTDIGNRITVTATGMKSGYYSASKTSGATAPVSGNVTSSRLAGSNRYDTSAVISQSGFAPGVPVAYVASGLGFPDALGAAPAASQLGGPLLLTDTTTLPPSVDQELRRLQPGRIVVVGGTPSVDDSVVAQLNAIAPTTRVAGTDRFDTSRAIVSDAFDSASVAYIATGLGFPDALTASAAAARVNGPVLLVNGGMATLDASTVSLLKSLGVTTVRIVGGSETVSNGIQSALGSAGFSVSRLAGSNRYETANAINAQAFGSAPSIYVASGETFPDALAGAALAGSKDAPMYLTSSGCIPESVSQAITRVGATQVVLLGGTPSLGAGVANFDRC